MAVKAILCSKLLFVAYEDIIPYFVGLSQYPLKTSLKQHFMN